MADFSGINDLLTTVRQAMNLIQNIRGLYEQCKQVQDIVARYQSGASPTLTGTVNALYTPAQRQELAAMVSQINALVADWEQNHVGVLAIG